MRLLLPQPSQLNSFLVALSFLSRLGPPRRLTCENFAKSIAWHGMVGICLGAMLFLAAYSVCLLPMAAPLWCKLPVAALVWLALEGWLTRGLHWDGVADLGDALGSGAVGTKFWQILKDSRMGAFGAMVMVLLMAGQLLAVTAHLAAWMEANRAFAWFTLLAAPCWGRLTPAWLGYKLQAYAKPSLGALICDNLATSTWLGANAQGFALLTVAFLLGLSFVQAICIVMAQILLTYWLRQVARRQGGLSGDFFGFQIEASQCLWLLFTL